MWRAWSHVLSMCVNAAVENIATALRERLVEGIPCIGPVAVCS